MEHLDLAMNTRQEAVYSSANDEGGGDMSERVSGLASCIYAEFERMIQIFGPSVVENLMPMVVNVLEQLETSYTESNEQSVDLELALEDNEQLMTQYEREKQLRKLAESKYLEFEDSREQDRQELQNVIDQLETQRKQDEIKIKHLQDQAERFEERSSEQKKEYDTLHTRHTEMLRAYVERMDNYNRMSPLPTNTEPSYDLRQNSFPGVISSELNHSPIDNDDQQQALIASQLEEFVIDDEEDKEQNVSFIDEIKEDKKTDQNISDSKDPSDVFNDSNNSSSKINTKKKLNINPLSINFENVTDEFNRDTSDELDLEEGKELFVTSGLPTYSAQTPKYLSPEAIAILQSTPELAGHTPFDVEASLTIVDSKNSQNDISLLAELQSLHTDAINSSDNNDALLSDQKGFKEIDMVLNENKELVEVRNKLQSQKNELLRRVEEILNDKELHEEEISGLQATKARMKLKISELEHSVKKARLENEKAQIQLKNKMAEEKMSSANRKRFTRVEMAKVLMERNQYKERLMELQEAVRWTEMIRASKENHLAALQQKKKSSVWRLFSNLFAGGTSAQHPNTKKIPVLPPVNVAYGAQSTPVSRRHSMNQNLANSDPSFPSKYTADNGLEGLTERQRLERKERYKLIKEHINSEGRKQAYGWSIPANYNGDQNNPVTVPVPVYCRPMNTEPNMKIWCASGINLEGGRTTDGKFIGIPNDIQEPLVSIVWIGTSTHSCSKVTIIDANNPSNALDSFVVSSSHLLCIAAVPGFSHDDIEVNVNQTSPEHSGSIMGIQAEEESCLDEDSSVDGTPALKVSSVLPTMWLGVQSGKVYIHSVIDNWKKCLQSAKLKDSLLSIVHIHGRVLAALADGTVAIFHRKPNGRWDLSNYHLLDLGRPHHSIRCMTPVHDFVWCGYRNKIQVINPRTMKIEKSFDAHPRRESQVRQLACIGDGVWVSIRLDSTLRLYNAHTYHHLQDVDIEPYVSKMLGTGKLGFSFVRITALFLTAARLWIGTGNGSILSVPLVSARPNSENEIERRGSSQVSTIDSPGTKLPGNANQLFMPYCAMINAQLSFHGHRDSVKFFIGVPGSAANVESAKAFSMMGIPPEENNSCKDTPLDNILVMSGGEGYIDFRVGDEYGDESKTSLEGPTKSSRIVTVERSHLLVWQVGGGKED